MMRDCGAAAVERLGLEDVAEEEDAQSGENTSTSGALESGSGSSQMRREWQAEGPDKPGETLSQTELDFIHLNLRKQSSYRCEKRAVSGPPHQFTSERLSATSVNDRLRFHGNARRGLLREQLTSPKHNQCLLNIQKDTSSDSKFVALRCG